MLLHPDCRPKPRSWDGRELRHSTVIEAKYDGYRVSIYKQNEIVYAYGRKPINLWPKIVKVRHLAHSLTCVPDGTMLDGELWVQGGKATDVVTAMNKRWDELTFTPFAIPVFHYQDVRDKMDLEQHDRLCRAWDLPKPDRMLYDRKATPATLCSMAVARELEGFILKEHYYGSWWKVKPVKTIDGFVTGVKPGRGKHKGRHGSLEISVFKDNETDTIVIANVGKGNDDDWRDRPQGEMLGDVCEISYEEVQSKGKLKFSSFIRWRPDKPATECTLSSLLG